MLQGRIYEDDTPNQKKILLCTWKQSYGKVGFILICRMAVHNRSWPTSSPLWNISEDGMLCYIQLHAPFCTVYICLWSFVLSHGRNYGTLFTSFEHSEYKISKKFQVASPYTWMVTGCHLKYLVLGIFYPLCLTPQKTIIFSVTKCYF